MIFRFFFIFSFASLLASSAKATSRCEYFFADGSEKILNLLDQPNMNIGRTEPVPGEEGFANFGYQFEFHFFKSIAMRPEIYHALHESQSGLYNLTSSSELLSPLGYAFQDAADPRLDSQIHEIILTLMNLTVLSAQQESDSTGVANKFRNYFSNKRLRKEIYQKMLTLPKEADFSEMIARIDGDLKLLKSDSARVKNVLRNASVDEPGFSELEKYHNILLGAIKKVQNKLKEFEIILQERNRINSDLNGRFQRPL